MRYGGSTEELCIKRIESGIRGISNGTKRPEETKVGYFLNKLQPLNEGMYQELLKKYVDVKKDYDKNNN
jgi:hypothetical protein